MFRTRLCFPDQRFRRRRTRGAATVETAICLPLFIIIVFGTIECCNLMFLRQGVLQAAYEGARVAIVPKAKSVNVREQVNRILVQRGIQPSAVRITPSNFEQSPFGTEVTVEVEAVPGANGLFTRFFQSGTVSGRATMMVEQDTQ